MATKPTDFPDWDTGNTNSLEPTSGDKLSGLPSGSSPRRQPFNWMFQILGKWVRYVDENLLDKNNNLSDLPDKAQARSTLGVESQAIAETKYLRIVNNLSELDPSNVRDQVDVYSKSEADARYINETDLSTDSETQTGTATDKVVTPASLSSRTATETRAGLVEKATTAEAIYGTADKFIDGATLQHALLNPIDRVAEREALGVYTGYFDITGTWVVQPPSWTVLYSGGRHLITHNLGTINYTVTANVVGRPASNADSVHIQNPTANTVQLEVVDSDDNQKQRAIMFTLIKG